MKCVMMALLVAMAGSMALAQEPAEVLQKIDQARQRVEEARQRAEDARQRAEMEIELMLGGPGVEGLGGAPGAREKIPYLGVSTVEAPPALAEQLGLARGMGLVVEFVDAGSPAQQAGIKQYDLVMKFDDQRLANPEQLRSLLRLREPKDEIKLSILRQGKPQEVAVKLGERQAEAMPLRHPGRARQNWARPLGGGNARLDVPGGGGGMIVTTTQGHSQTTFRDDKMTVTLERKDGQPPFVTARDREGKTIFEGPIDTPEQRKAMPEDVAKKVEEMEKVQMREGRMDAPQAVPFQARFAGARARVLVSNAQDLVLLAKFENGKAAHAWAFSTAQGKVLFDGPVATDDQRKELPEAVAKQLDVLEKNQHAASEFGVVR